MVSKVALLSGLQPCYLLLLSLKCKRLAQTKAMPPQTLAMCRFVTFVRGHYINTKVCINQQFYRQLRCKVEAVGFFNKAEGIYVILRHSNWVIELFFVEKYFYISSNMPGGDLPFQSLYCILPVSLSPDTQAALESPICLVLLHLFFKSWIVCTFFTLHVSVSAEAPQVSPFILSPHIFTRSL